MEDKISGASSMHRGDENVQKKLPSENLKRRDQLENLGVKRRIILK
jgi:hypothetical protein